MEPVYGQKGWLPDPDKPGYLKYDDSRYFKSIKNIENVNEKKRDSEYLAAGLLAAPVALGYLWKKNHIYTLIEYDDGTDMQKIVLDFDNNANYAQGLIYKKMLEFRKD